MPAVNEFIMPAVDEIKETVLDALQHLFNRKQPSTRDRIFKRIRQLLPAIVIAAILVVVGRLGMLALDRDNDNGNDNNTFTSSAPKSSVANKSSAPKPSAQSAQYNPSPTYNRPETSNWSKTSN